MARKMGLDFGLNHSGRFVKRKFRYLMRIDDVVADDNKAQKTLPPLSSARPSLSFKEMNANHLIEEVFYPARPDWKPINLVLYDLKLDNNPVWDWITEFYNPEEGTLVTPNEDSSPTSGFIRKVTLDLFDGCGSIVESWVYEDAWPTSINFQTLDMGDTGVCTIDLSLRYVRAYVIDPSELPVCPEFQRTIDALQQQEEDLAETEFVN